MHADSFGPFGALVADVLEGVGLLASVGAGSDIVPMGIICSAGRRTGGSHAAMTTASIAMPTLEEFVIDQDR